ncbi:MAG: YbaN family protein [Christensenellaceae bacterium]|jgi:uncharacterized membrane protein YbaN (DUF454 family)|nr:YbaN family protein [Christensenellaceae bacterium]
MKINDITFTNHDGNILIEGHKCLLPKRCVLGILNLDSLSGKASSESLSCTDNSISNITHLDCLKLLKYSAGEFIQHINEIFCTDFDVQNVRLDTLFNRIYCAQNGTSYNNIENEQLNHTLENIMLSDKGILIKDLTSEDFLIIYCVLLSLDKPIIHIMNAIDKFFEILNSEKHLIQYCLEILKSKNNSFIIASNSLVDITKYASDIILLNDSEIIKCGDKCDPDIKIIIDRYFTKNDCEENNDSEDSQRVSSNSKNSILEKCKSRDQKLSKKIINVVLLIIGTICLALGTVGIVLPILPTTPFLIITALCYAKGSKKFEKWFTSTRIYKKHLEPFLKTKAMTNANKVKVLLLVTVLISIPIIMVDVLVMRIVLGLVILMHYVIFIFKVKSKSKVEIQQIFDEIKANEKEETLKNEASNQINNILE